MKIIISEGILTEKDYQKFSKISNGLASYLKLGNHYDSWDDMDGEYNRFIRYYDNGRILLLKKDATKLFLLKQKKLN